MNKEEKYCIHCGYSQHAHCVLLEEGTSTWSGNSPCGANTFDPGDEKKLSLWNKTSKCRDCRREYKFELYKNMRNSNSTNNSTDGCFKVSARHERRPYDQGRISAHILMAGISVFPVSSWAIFLLNGHDTASVIFAIIMTILYVLAWLSVADLASDY